MQNSNPTPVTPPKKFLGQLVLGVSLLLVGILLLKEANLARSERSWIGQRFETLLVASPMLLLLGVVMLIVGLFRFLKRLVFAGPLVSAQQKLQIEKAWRACIWVITGATIFPWWWLHILTRMEGGRPGNEGEGMGGFIITTCFGLPALALAIYNEFRLRWNRNRDQRP